MSGKMTCKSTALAFVISILAAGCSSEPKITETIPLASPQADILSLPSPSHTVEISPAAGTASPPPSGSTDSDSPPLSVSQSSAPVSYIIPGGMTVKERFSTPDGYTRVEPDNGSFAEFLQNLPLKPDGSVVKYFDGRSKSSAAYLAVVDYPLGERDLQQCADAVIRLRAEYFYQSDQQERIRFHFVNGFLASFPKWSQGYGISVNGNDVQWKRNNANNGSYESFQKYLDMVYSYASTLSLDKELDSIDITQLAIGDVFIRGGSPGHCVIVADMAVSKASGKKSFILAQSYMPAQDIQILKCPAAGNASPWYTDDFGDILVTPEYTFLKTELKTWP